MPLKYRTTLQIQSADGDKPHGTEVTDVYTETLQILRLFSSFNS